MSFKKYLILPLILLVADFSYACPWQYNHDVVASDGMVVSADSLATKIGANILAHGGNAVDAAVAVGYALAVVHPCCGNIGGGGFMVMHLVKNKNHKAQNLFLNFREKAPLKATKNMFLDNKGNIISGKSLHSYQAIGVPGTVLGLNTALKKYGTMSLKEVMAPAIKLAKDGFKISPSQQQFLGSPSFVKKISKNFTKAWDIFTKKGKPYVAGDKLIQQDLAHTLELISKYGSKAFYDGSIAKAVVKASKTHGGILSLKDFKQYTVQIRKPIECNYRGYKIYAAAPPSSGGVTLCETLGILSGYNLSKYDYHSATNVHRIIESLRHAFAERNMNLGDPDFITNPIRFMLSKGHFEHIRSEIKPNKATPSSEVKGFITHEGMHTTHYSVVDKYGNAVATTYTLNYYFGTGYIAGDTGFFLNDEMDDFTSKVGQPNAFGLIQGNNNAIEPGKRPLSSMTPTIVTDKTGKVLLVTGSPGGSTIITTVLQIILDTVDYHMNLYAAVSSPRFHHQWYPDNIRYEPNAFSLIAIQRLKEMGYAMVPYKSKWGAAESIERGKSGSIWDGSSHKVKSVQYWEGVNDPRRLGGSAKGN